MTINSQVHKGGEVIDYTLKVAVFFHYYQAFRFAEDIWLHEPTNSSSLLYSFTITNY